MATTFTVKGPGEVQKVIDKKTCKLVECQDNINGKCILVPKPTTEDKNNICTSFN